MSQINAGSATIDLKVRAEQAEAELAKARAELDKIKTSGEKSSGSLVGGLNAARESAAKLTRALIAIPAAAVAAFTAGRKIREAFNLDDTKLLETMRFISTVDFSNVSASVGALNKQIADLQTAAAASERSLADAFVVNFIEGEKNIKERLALLEGARDTLARKAQDDQAKLEEAERKARWEAAKKRIADRKAEIQEIADAEKEARDREFAEAVEDEMRHREWLKEQDEKRHKDELDRIRERHEAEMRNARELSEELARIRQQQESGFTALDVTGGGAGLRGSIMARFGRGNGRG